MIGNWFGKTIILENLLNTVFSLGNVLITICVRCVWIVIYFLFEKQTFNGLLNVHKICILIFFFSKLYDCYIYIDNDYLVDIIKDNKIDILHNIYHI